MKKDSLLARITRLATADSTYEKGRRVLTGMGSDAILPAILQEIDETVLARELTFHASPDRKISIVAKGRRLWKINSAKPKSLIPDGVNIISTSLSGDDIPTIEALSALMANFADGAKNLTVSVSDSKPERDYSAMGLTVAALRDYWQVSAWAEDLSTLQKYLILCDDDILAYILLDKNGPVSSSGTEKRVELLMGMAQNYGADIDKQTQSLHPGDTQNRLIILNQNARNFIAHVESEGQRALIMGKMDNLPNVISHWWQSDMSA